jgi:hypothetical protein
MHTRRKLDFSGQSDPVAGDHRAVGLGQGELKMRRFHFLAHLLGEFRKELAHYVVRRKAVRVLCLKIHLANNALRIDVDEPRVRHPLGHAVRLRVKDIEAANHFGILIGKQWKFDFVPAGKVLQDHWTVITDRRELDTLGFKSLFCILQLHELRFAEGSPIRGTEEEKHRAVRPLERLIGLLVPKLVTDGKRWRFLPDRKSDR